jgi:hypothetical protein
MVGFSSISVWRQLPFFGTTYVSTKIAASYIGMAVCDELKASKFAGLLDHMTVYPGGVLTGIFNRPESSQFGKLMPLQALAMQST